MTRKTQEAYTHLFQYINTEIIVLHPHSFMTDYEVVMRNALRFVWPEAQMAGCWFHFCQAVKRHGSQIGGFLMAARKNTDTAKVYYQILCLPLLPAAYITDAFNLIRMKASAAHGDLFDTFMDYVERQWIKKVNFYLHRSPHLLSIFIFVLIVFFPFHFFLGGAAQYLGRRPSNANHGLTRGLQLRP